jgi:translocation and assembly module TamB
MSPTDRGKTRRRLFWRAALAVTLVVVGSIASLPWLLALAPAQRWMAARASAILAPAGVEFEVLRLSWLRPTEVIGLVLRDAQGDRVLASPRSVFQWNLGQILFHWPKTARLKIEHGDLDIERNADGTVDLYETLRPVIVEHPKQQLIIHIQNGRLRFRDPALAEPLLADEADILLDLSRDFEPVTWNISFHRARTAGDAAQLKIEGSQSRAEADAEGNRDVTVSLKGSHWPWAVAASGIHSRGDFSGTIAAQRRVGAWDLSGDAAIQNLEAAAASLFSDTIRLDQVSALWKAAGHDQLWTIEQLALDSPLGSLRGEGMIPATVKRGAWFAGSVDLAALFRQLPRTLHLREGLQIERGSAEFRAEARVEPPGPAQTWRLKGSVSELVAIQDQKGLTIPEPARFEAMISRHESSLTLERLKVQTPFLTATGQGDVDRGIDVTATLDLAAFSARFHDWIELGSVEPAGVCKLDAHYRREGKEFEAKLDAALSGMRLGGLPLVGTFERSEISVGAQAKGGADSAGWPVDWRQWSLRARSGDADLALEATGGGAAGDMALEARGVTQLTVGGTRRRAEGEFKLKWDQKTWTGDRIALALLPDSAWGPGLGPGAAIRWLGRGRYEPTSDELILESTPNARATPGDPPGRISGRQRMRIHGLKGLGATRIEARASADLADLSPLFAPDGGPWTGKLDTFVNAQRERDLWNLGLRAEIHDLSQLAGGDAQLGSLEEVVLGVNGTYAPRGDHLQLTELALKAPYVRVEGAGVVRELTRAAQVDLRGSLAPDWSALTAELARRVEPNARVAGRPRSWRLSGSAANFATKDPLNGLRGECGIQLDDLDVFGMRLRATALVLRADDGKVRIDPIDSSLNGGALHLEPEVVRENDGSLWLRLGRSSVLQGAIINDEVSHRVLSFAAPVLDGATRVRGQISVKLTDAVFPIRADAGAQAKILGDMLFDDVRFMPGPLADELLGAFRREDRPLLVLRDPISVRIQGRKVYQKGLAIPLGKAASIALEGSVDFDRNLDMVASFGMVPSGAGDSVLGPLVKNARIEIPIRGTLNKPKVDGDAMKERLKSIGSDLLETTLEAGSGVLGKLLNALPVPQLRGFAPPVRRMAPASPPQPEPPQANEPPPRPKPRTPEERRRLREQRKQQRLEKKADRRLKSEQPASANDPRPD